MQPQIRPASEAFSIRQELRCDYAASVQVCDKAVALPRAGALALAVYTLNAFCIYTATSNCTGRPGSPAKSQKEGQEDQGTPKKPEAGHP